MHNQVGTVGDRPSKESKRNARHPKQTETEDAFTEFTVNSAQLRGK